MQESALKQSRIIWQFSSGTIMRWPDQHMFAHGWVLEEDGQEFIRIVHLNYYG
jgi:hypothetical protein